ncbi:hypothetical protein KC727_03060 [Candidatus Kaiserbacteria bacterium]|nr:hypothetical protein [Candidatus Kaiserbacteria bacterium]
MTDEEPVVCQKCRHQNPPREQFCVLCDELLPEPDQKKTWGQIPLDLGPDDTGQDTIPDLGFDGSDSDDIATGRNDAGE